jgi:NADPH:quinone reductase-like Zn-dependent oxidoreductase
MSDSTATEAGDITIIVTGAAGTGGMACIQALQRTTEFTTVGADMNPKAVGLYAADDIVAGPPATNDGWVERIRDHVSVHQIDVVLRLIEEGVAQISNLRAAVPDGTV